MRIIAQVEKTTRLTMMEEAIDRDSIEVLKWLIDIGLKIGRSDMSYAHREGRFTIVVLVDG